MQTKLEAICWAVLIIVLALVMKSNGASDAAAFGVVSGVSAAACGSLARRHRGQNGCGKGCM